MLSRSTLLAALFTLTLLAGAGVFYFHHSFEVSATSRLAFLKKEVFEANFRTTDSSGWLERLPLWTEKLLANKELVLYGALGLLAVSILILIAGDASSKAKDPKDSMLEALIEEKKKAEHLAKIKADFLNHVSHELRTPLAVIIGYIECITDGLYGQIGTKHQEILEIVSKQSSHLKEMIDQILIYSRLESNRQSLSIQEFPLSSMISELRDTFGFLCKQKDLDLRWDLSSEPITLHSDPDTLKEILSNLLQNAVKYTDRGSIMVRVRNLSHSHSIVLEVTDTGMGISESYLSMIFEPFIQVHKTSTEQSRGGIGLGLSIVKKHVEHIKGTISVESELGRGSTFRITLPQLLEERSNRERQLFGLLKIPYLRLAKSSAHLPAQPSTKEAKSASQAVG
jgi:signal transduction histidine kinase